MQSPPKPRLSDRLRAGLFFAVAPEDRGEFARAIAFANFKRAKLFSLVVALLAAGAGLLPPGAGADPHAGFASPFAYHALLTVMGVAYFFVQRRWEPAEVSRAGGCQQRLALGFALAILAALAGVSAAQYLPGDTVPVYLLGVAVFATCFYTSPVFTAAALAGCAGVFLGVLAALGSAPPTARALVLMGAFLGCFWCVSRYVHSLKAREVGQLRTIARQTAALELTNTRLREANALKGELLEIAAHDLRDPLHSINGLTQILRDELPRDLPARELVLSIREAAQRMAGLVENLLAHVEAEAVELRLQREPVDLPALAAAVVDEHRPAATAKNLQLEWELLTVSPGLAHVDPRRVRQIFENLVSNAVKYSPPGASIRCRLECAPDGSHRFSVHDEGAGLTAEDLRRMFIKFQRLSARPTGGETSTGLGLAIVKNLVELHGGRVWAESAGPGQGSTFHVVLPPAAPTTDAAVHPGSDVRV